MTTRPDIYDEKERIKQFVRYDHETGKLFRRAKLPGNGSKPVDTEIKGWPSNNGHIYVSPIGGKRRYTVHRIAWLLMTGDWPESEVDHIDHNPANNKWSNLRAVDKSANMRNQNLNRRNKIGVSGVCWATRKSKWFVQVGGRQHRFAKYFDNLLDAVAAAFRARADLGFHPNHGQQLRGDRA